MLGLALLWHLDRWWLLLIALPMVLLGLAYNAGPRRVALLRRRADELGLDGNRWFGNVEVAALELVGREPVRYVARINKYYLAYRMAEVQISRRTSAREVREARQRWLSPALFTRTSIGPASSAARFASSSSPSRSWRSAGSRCARSM